MELYVNARNSQKSHHVSSYGSSAWRPRHQAVLKLLDPSDPAWPSIAAVLREMADAGVEINEAAYGIAAKIGGHRHRLAMRTHGDTRRQSESYVQMTLAGTGDSIVYYVRRGGFIKIGTTVEPVRRFANLMPEEILAFEPGTKKLEQLRHRQFSHLRRARREYFAEEPELLEHIRQLRHLHGDPDPSWPTIATQRVRRQQPCLPALVSHERVTAAEASERFGISEDSVWRWARRGLISQAGEDDRRRRLFYVEHLLAMNARSRRRPRRERPSGDM